MSARQNFDNQSNMADEQGFILIVTMLVLVVLTVLCVAGLDNSIFEVQIAANDRQSRVAFNLADGTVNSIGTLIEETYTLGADPDYVANGLIYIDLPDTDDGDYSPAKALGDADVDVVANGVDLFSGRVMGFTDPRVDGKHDFLLRTPNGLGDVFGRITRHVAEAADGKSAEWPPSSNDASGSKGITLVIDFDIISHAARNSSSDLAIRYRMEL